MWQITGFVLQRLVKLHDDIHEGSHKNEKVQVQSTSSMPS